MRNKMFMLGVLVMVLAFGLSLVGCVSVKPNYYNFGVVSEDNCALIRVCPVSLDRYIKEGTVDKDIYSVDVYASINGRNGLREWQRSSIPFVGDGDFIVRVAPGEYTFAVKFFTSQEGRQNSLIEITYNVEAGKGYSFNFSCEESQQYGLLTVRVAKFVIYEWELDENGEFGSFSYKGRRKVVATQTKLPI
jgi:hypothetical protein